MKNIFVQKNPVKAVQFNGYNQNELVYLSPSVLIGKKKKPFLKCDNGDISINKTDWVIVSNIFDVFVYSDDDFKKFYEPYH